MTTQELIRANNQRPVRRCYIKRKLATDGSYETEWLQINTIDGKSKVLKWGTVTLEIDAQEGRIGGFNISGVTMSFDNSEGLFNSELDPRSIWAKDSLYLNRKYTKLKIVCGYLDEDNVETGVATVFEGVIDSVKTGDDQKASVKCLSYQSILKGYDISDLALTGTKTINQIVDLITNQTKITTFIPFVAAAADQNADITDSSLLEGTYWDVLTALAYKSASVPLLDGTIWTFTTREASASSVFDFIGKGTRGSSDIIKINQYDDGDSKVKVNWIVDGTNIQAQTTDPLLQKKYLDEPEIINLDDVDTTPQKQAIVDELLSQWENPKPILDFTTRFFINILKPTDKITISLSGQTVPVDTFLWGSFSWGDGSKWGKKIGSIIISATDGFMITRVSKDIDSYTFKIRCEKIPA